MKVMKRRKVILTISIIVVIALIAFLIWKAVVTVNTVTDESLRWTMIGAFGSWAGSIFGAIALVIAILAFWLPQKVKIKVAVSTGMMITDMPGIDRIEAYIVTIKNVGMRAVTVNNVYLNFGRKKGMGDIFVGMLNRESLLQAYTPTFPKRLDQGESFDYYLLREKLEIALAHYEERTALDTPLFIRVDEVTQGSRYYKTKWTLGTFIGHKG